MEYFCVVEVYSEHMFDDCHKEVASNDERNWITYLIMQLLLQFAELCDCELRHIPFPLYIAVGLTLF